MLGLGPEEDKFENGGHGGFLESFKVWMQADLGLLWQRAKKANSKVIVNLASEPKGQLEVTG